MGLFIGSTTPSKIFVGDTQISKVFVGDTQVRPSGWQPGANTYIYYPLTSDLVDVMGNGNTGTIHGTVNFSEETGVTVNGGSGYVTGLTNGISNRNTYTQIFWAKWDGKIDNYGMLLGDSSNYNTNSAFSFELGGSSSNFFRNYQFIGNNSAISMPDENYDTNRHLRITVANNGVYKVYKDAVLRGNSLNNGTINNKPNMNIGRSSYYTSRREAKGKIKGYIVETVARTAQEVLNYYNSTKDNYPATLNSLQNINLTPTNEINITPNNNGSGNVQSI